MLYYYGLKTFWLRIASKELLQLFNILVGGTAVNSNVCVISNDVKKPLNLLRILLRLSYFWCPQDQLLLQLEEPNSATV